jgi:hypothetical protein
LKYSEKVLTFGRVRAAAALVGVLSFVVACGPAGSGPSGRSDAVDDAAANVPADPPVSQRRVLEAIKDAAAIVKVPAGLRPGITEADKDTGFAILGAAGCLPSFSDTAVEVGNCIFGKQTATRTMVIVGDSHASMWLPGFDQIGKRLGWKVINFNKVSCGAASLEPFLYQEKRPYSECVAWHRWVIGEVKRLAPQLVVFTSAVDIGDQGNGEPSTPQIWQAGLTKTLSAVRSPGTERVVLGDIPYIKHSSSGAGPVCLSAHQRNMTACSAPADQAILRDYQRAEQAAAKATGARYIDVTPWFCSARCWPVVDDIQIYSDWQHITATYAKYLSGSVQESLAPELHS